MSHANRLFGVALALSSCLVSGKLAARPPAYSMHTGFTTALHNVSGKVECEDEACHDTMGQVVAEGASEAFDAPIAVTIREYRDRSALAIKPLEELAHKSEKKRGAGSERRLISGQVNGHPAVEIWSTNKPCAPEVRGRVLIALPDKVVEVETTAKSEDADFPTEAFEALDSILRGVRIRRLEDAAIDPAASKPEDSVIRPADFVCAEHTP